MQKKWIWITLGVIILAVLLIMAFIFTANIFGPACKIDGGCGINVLKMSNNEIIKCLGVPEISSGLELGIIKKTFICPTSKQISVKSGENKAIALGIKNVVRNSSVESFSYNISIASNTSQNCGKSAEEMLKLIILGQVESNIQITYGEIYITRIAFSSKGSPLCTVRYRINVYADNKPYSAELFYVTFN
jgi:hypothetical protein